MTHVISYRLIAGQEIMPGAIRSLVLPSAAMVAHMGESSAVCGPVDAAIAGLFMIRIKTHGLPVMHFQPAIVVGISGLGDQRRHRDPVFAGCVGGVHGNRGSRACTLGGIYVIVCNPVLDA